MNDGRRRDDWRAMEFCSPATPVFVMRLATSFLAARRFACALGLVTAAVASTPRDTAAQRPFKVYISVDLEGIAGVVTGDQLGPTGFEYGRAREFMTAEALAAIAGARDAGATEILVSDSHGNGESLLIDQFPDDVRIVRSWPRPLMMMEGVDSTLAREALRLAAHKLPISTACARAARGRPTLPANPFLFPCALRPASP